MGQSGEQAGLSTSMEWWTLLLLNEEISLVFPLFSCVSSWLFFFQNKNIQCTTYISATVYCFLAKLLVTHLSTNHWSSACQPLTLTSLPSGQCYHLCTFTRRYIGKYHNDMNLIFELKSMSLQWMFVIGLHDILHKSVFEQSL